MPKRPADIRLTDKELDELRRLSQGSQKRLAIRAQIIMACNEGKGDSEVARLLTFTGRKCNNQMVGYWRKRFRKGRVEGLDDEPRTGAPSRKLCGTQVEKVVAAILEGRPSEGTRWTIPHMADQLHLSRRAVTRIWRDFELLPHRRQYFPSDDPLFNKRVRAVAGIYMSAKLSALVLCVDAKSRVHALCRSQPSLPENSGRKRPGQFLKFLESIDLEIPPKLDLYIISDNEATDETTLGWLAERRRYRPYFTSNQGLWLKHLRFWTELLYGRQNKRCTPTSARLLSDAIRHLLSRSSSDLKKSQKMFRWASRCHTGRARLWKTSGAKARHTSQPSIDINHEK